MQKMKPIILRFLVLSLLLQGVAHASQPSKTSYSTAVIWVLAGVALGALLIKYFKSTTPAPQNPPQQQSPVQPAQQIRSDTPATRSPRRISLPMPVAPIQPIVVEPEPPLVMAAQPSPAIEPIARRPESGACRPGSWVQGASLNEVMRPFRRSFNKSTFGGEILRSVLSGKEADLDALLARPEVQADTFLLPKIQGIKESRAIEIEGEWEILETLKQHTAGIQHIHAILTERDVEQLLSEFRDDPVFQRIRERDLRTMSPENKWALLEELKPYIQAILTDRLIERLLKELKDIDRESVARLQEIKDLRRQELDIEGKTLKALKKHVKAKYRVRSGGRVRPFAGRTSASDLFNPEIMANLATGT